MDNMEEYHIMSRFPLLSAADDLKKWTGFLSTRIGRTIRISLVVPAFPSATGIYLDVNDLDEEAQNYWGPLLEQISAIECDTVLQFLEALEAQERGMSTTVDLSGNVEDNEMSHEDNSELYPTIIEEIESIGVNNVVSLSSDFKQIELMVVDRSKREHKLKLAIPGGYPRVKPNISAELPFPKDSIDWPERIGEIYKIFKSYVEKCCRFWDDVEELDYTVRVIDPIQPNKSHFHRRILLEDSVIIHLVFNPLAPRAFPQINFAGPDKHVDAFNSAIDSECNLWDDSLKVIQNLKSILCCQFVMKDSADDNLEEQEPCTICYVYNFEDEIPEITCVCKASYHRQCLQDLFVSDVKKSAFRRFVECPNCQMEIRVPAGFVTW